MEKTKIAEHAFERVRKLHWGDATIIHTEHNVKYRKRKEVAYMLSKYLNIATISNIYEILLI
jgi:hypothetical protein